MSIFLRHFNPYMRPGKNLELKCINLFRILHVVNKTITIWLDFHLLVRIFNPGLIYLQIYNLREQYSTRDCKSRFT